MGGIIGALDGSNGHVDAPTAQNVGTQGQDTLSSEIQLAPQQYSAYSTYSPQYAQTDVSTLGKSLFGANYNGDLSDINQQLTNQSNQQTNQANSALRSGNLSDVQSLSPEYQNLLKSSNPELYSALASQAKAAQTGVSQDAAQTQMQQMAGQSAAFNPVSLNQTYGTNVGARNVYAQNGNQALSSMQAQYAANPGLNTTQSMADQQAQALLAQGGNLSPSELTAVQQASRAGYAARGLDGTNSSIVDEAMQTDAAQRARQLQNISTAEGIQSQTQAQQQAQQQFGLGVSGQAANYGAMNLSAQQSNQTAGLNAGLANQANNFAVQSANNANLLSQQQNNLAAQNQQYNQLGQSAQLDYGRQAQNFSMGQSALGNYQANVYDPEAAVVGQNSTNAGSNTAMFGMGNSANQNSAVMNMFQPYTQYSSALNNSNATLAAQGQQQSAANMVGWTENAQRSDAQVASSW